MARQARLHNGSWGILAVDMRVRVLAFARLRELLGGSVREVEMPAGAVAGDVWTHLERACPQLHTLKSSTRLARAGRVVLSDEPLYEGDEIALLPPVGGG